MRKKTHNICQIRLNFKGILIIPSRFIFVLKNLNYGGYVKISSGYKYNFSLSKHQKYSS